MATANVQIGTTGESYAGLRERHYELGVQKSATRKQEEYGFEIHKKVVLLPNAYEELVQKQEEQIKARDEKLYKRREYSKMDNSLEGYYKRLNAQKRRKHTASTDHPMIMTLSNLEDYNELVKVLEKKGISEEEVRKVHADALEEAAKRFNELPELDKYLKIDEYYLHANEDGVPHLHARLLTDHSTRHGLPSGSPATAMREAFGTGKDAQKAMTLFREQTDNLIMDAFRPKLYNAVKDKDYTKEEADIINSYLDLKRTGGEVFKDQGLYILKQREKELEEKKEAQEKEAQEKAQRQAQKEEQLEIYDVNLKGRELEISNVESRQSEKELKLSDKEEELKDREESLEVKEEVLNTREEELNKYSEELGRWRDKIANGYKELTRIIGEVARGKMMDIMEAILDRDRMQEIKTPEQIKEEEYQAFLDRIVEEDRQEKIREYHQRQGRQGRGRGHQRGGPSL